jgi:opacity protein-like surface antigen
MEALMLRRLGFMVMAAVLTAAPTFAQDEPPVQLTIGGGFTGVYGSASDHIGNGGNFTIGALFNNKSPIAFQAEYGWNGMKQKQLSLPVFPTVNPLTSGTPTDFFADANMQYFDANALLHGKTGGKASPYGIVGLGYYHRPVTITTPGVGYTTVCDPYWYACYPALVSVDQVVGERSSNDFGMNIGGGVNYKVGEHSSIYFEVRYHYIWGPTIEQSKVPTQPIAGVTPTAPSSLKANGQFLPITVGFRF